MTGGGGGSGGGGVSGGGAVSGGGGVSVGGGVGGGGAVLRPPSGPVTPMRCLSVGDPLQAIYGFR